MGMSPVETWCVSETVVEQGVVPDRMRRRRAVRKLTLAVILAGLAATPAVASIMVVGNTLGASCYQAARSQSGSDEALSICDRAFKEGEMNFHDTVATHVNRGIVNVYRKDYQSAVADFDRAIAMNPNEPESYLNKGSTLLRMGAGANQAIPLLNESLERNTRKPELAYFSRAIAHEISGDVQSAYADYKRAQELAPRWAQPSRELSRFQVRRASASSL
jgi:tetratricopeptide (TPR) repeat protein